MDDERAWRQRAQDALDAVARATGITYSAAPKAGAISLFNDHRNNVCAMLVTAINERGEVERGVTPYGDPSMTAREFVEAASLAESAVYALHHHRVGGRIDPQTHAATSKAMVDTSEAEPQAKAQTLLDLLAAEIGLPPQRITADELGLLTIAQPSPFGSAAMTAGQLSNALTFALHAVYHHERFQQRIAANADEPRDTNKHNDNA